MKMNTLKDRLEKLLQAGETPVCEVYAGGVRGSHGCTSHLLLAVEGFEYDPASARPYVLYGKIVAVKDCPVCKAFQGFMPGNALVFSGWHNPEYYGHDGLQL